MKVLIQRVSGASVSIKGLGIKKSIAEGLVLFIGIKEGDSEKEAEYLAEKIPAMRVFTENGKFNLSLLDLQAEIMVVSQFTLLADCKKGRRPDFNAAAEPGKAKEIYTSFIDKLSMSGLKVAEGEFGAEMLVEINNDGPVTIILDTDELIRNSSK